MKKFISIAASALIILGCAAGCGNNGKKDTADVKVSVESVNNKTVEELQGLYTGIWETSVVFINNQDGIDFGIDSYEFIEDGTGTFTPQNGKPEAISWKVTPEGDLDVVFEEKGEKEILFEYISGNLVSLETNSGETVESHFVKIGGVTEEEEDAKKSAAGKDKAAE